MSRYDGLDKVDMTGLKPVETYQGVKIFLLVEGSHEQINEGYAVVSRNYLIDEQFNGIEDARTCIEHFFTK